MWPSLPRLLLNPGTPGTLNPGTQEKLRLHLDNNFLNFDNNQVSILIGTKNLDLVTYQTTKEGPENAPRVISKQIGRTIGGPTADLLGKSVLRAYSSHIKNIYEDAEPSELLATT